MELRVRLSSTFVITMLVLSKKKMQQVLHIKLLISHIHIFRDIKDTISDESSYIFHNVGQLFQVVSILIVTIVTLKDGSQIVHQFSCIICCHVNLNQHQNITHEQIQNTIFSLHNFKKLCSFVLYLIKLQLLRHIIIFLL